MAVENQLSLLVDIRKDINRWLSPSNVTDDLAKHLSEYSEGSCEWIIADTAFENILSVPKPSVLRVLARPGGGKSTAAAFLISHLSELGSGATLYFFCKASDAEKRSASHILRSLLWQCLQYDSDLYSTMVLWYYQSGRSIADSKTDVAAMFDACVQKTALPEIFIVIDGLDECLDSMDLLLTLSSAMVASRCPLKLILLSRDVTLPELPLPQSRTIHLTTQKCQSSIESYVKERLREIKSLGEHRHDDQLAESISNAADGLWLVARLLLDELHHAPSLGEVRRQISGLPHGLRSLYSSILSAKDKTFSDVQLAMAQELFLWIDTSDYLPKFLRWYDKNDCLGDETICTIMDVATASRQLFNPPELVKQLASPLLEVRIIFPHPAVDQHGVPYDCTSFTVDFFHQTVSQYLKWTMDAKPTDLPQSLKPRRLAALYRGVTATRYLSQDENFGENLQQLRERPRDGIFPNYVEFVYGLWGALKTPYLRGDLDAEEIKKAGILCDQLTHFLTTDKCLGWIEAAIIINYAGKWTRLIENVEDVLEVASDPLSSTPAFHRFHCARQVLMTDYLFVLASTWPKDALPPQLKSTVKSIPQGFYQRPLARKVMAIARKYQWLLSPPHARSSNCFSINGRV
jgi:hypothetical protein